MKAIVYFFLLLTLTAQGQQTNKTINAKIEGNKTSKHINIPGTRLNIIPPAGFAIANTFKGLQKDKNNAINITDSIGDNIYDFDLPGLKEAYEESGAKVVDDKNITVQGYMGRYILSQVSPNTQSHILIFGDSTFCTQIVTVFLITDKETGNEIVQSLNTIYYEKEREIYPLDTAGFTLDENVSKFKYFGFNAKANVYAYFVGGLEDKKDAKRPFVMIAKLPDNATEDMTGLNKIIDKLNVEKYGLVNPNKKNISTKKMNNFKAYQADTYGQINSENAVVYHCIITDGNKIFLLQGVAQNDLENNLVEFKKLAATIRIK